MDFNNISINNNGEAVADDPFARSIPKIDTNSLLMRVFKWMAVGLGISAISALLGSKFLASALANGYTWVSPVMFGLIIVELILVIVFSAKLRSMSSSQAKGCFIAYSIIDGLTLSSVLLVYTTASITGAFLSAAAMFGAAALYRKITNKDLSKFGSFFMMALVGIIVASIINIFIGNSILDLIISIVGIVIFVGLTAYDVNKINAMANEEPNFDENTSNKIVIWGALQLYLDFINIFLRLLSLMGKRRN